jgi:hypothetical protein
VDLRHSAAFGVPVFVCRCFVSVFALVHRHHSSPVSIVDLFHRLLFFHLCKDLRIPQYSHTHTHTHILTHTYSLSLTHTHKHIHTPTHFQHIHTHTHTHTFNTYLKYIHTNTYTHTHINTVRDTYTHVFATYKCKHKTYKCNLQLSSVIYN